MKKADLHAHTTASDGTFTPQALVAEAWRVRLDVLAIADHDSTEGIAPAYAANAGHALKIIPAIEVNCDIPGGEVHILGYFKEVPGGELQAMLKRLRDGRFERAKGMADKMSALGMPVSFKRVQELAGTGSLGRPHVARAILEAGYVATIGEAFERFIGRNGPAYFERLQLSPAEAVQAIHASGGVPVLAHPYSFDAYGNVLKTVNPETLVPQLVPAGLRGVEAHYYRYPTSATVGIMKLAQAHGLIVTGGSDFHGSTKPDQGLGCVHVPWEVVEGLIAEIEKAWN
ncbi:MAG: PHP domain-containing protein [Chloroflexi bacterium]|nr:PHP domain-containing protein [Chloroflexota bacterium]